MYYINVISIVGFKIWDTFGINRKEIGSRIKFDLWLSNLDFMIDNSPSLELKTKCKGYKKEQVREYFGFLYS